MIESQNIIISKNIVVLMWYQSQLAYVSKLLRILLSNSSIVTNLSCERDSLV